MTRARAGLRAQDAGRAWEDFLSAHIFAHLLHEGAIVRLDKLIPPTKAVSAGPGRKPRLIHEAPTGADWIGLLPGGRYLAMEAKSTEGDRLGFDALTERQVEHLAQVAAIGGVALLMVQYRVSPGWTEHFAVPWLAAPWKRARTAQALYLEDLGVWKVGGWEDLGRVLKGKD